MKIKLNDIATLNTITAYGFKTFKDYAATYSNGKGKNNVIISTLSPAVMAEQGITVYYAPELPRGTVYNTAEDVYNADLVLNHVTVFAAPDVNALGYAKVLIVSRHPGTIDILKEMYPDAYVLNGNVTPEDIMDAFVVGTLPPHSIQYVKAYRAVTINDFDYVRDGDLQGKELQRRLHICNPICIAIN